MTEWSCDAGGKRRWPGRALAALLICAALIVAPGCTPESPTPHGSGATASPASAPAPAVPAAPAAASSTGAPGPAPSDGVGPDGLLTVPYPELERLDPAVQEQLRDARVHLEKALAPGSLDAVARAAEYGDLGQHYHAYGLLDAAVACYLNARALDDARFDWPYYLGHVQRDLGRSADAIASFQQALAIRPEDVPTLIHLAAIHLDDENQPDRAEPLLIKAREIDGRCAAAIDGLGRIASSRGDHQAARVLFEESLAIDPNASAVRYRLGMAYRKLGNLEEAKRHLQSGGSGRARFPDPLMDDIAAIKTGMRAHLTRGNELYLAKNYVDAEGEFRLAIAADPDAVMPHTNLGSILVYLGRPAEAQKEFELALRLDPNHVQANFNLGTLLAKGGDDRHAVAHYRSALGVHAEHDETLFNLANALRRLGEFEEALVHYREVIAIEPGNEDLRIAATFCFVALERWPEAHAAIARGFKDLSSSARIAHVVARLMVASPLDEHRDGRRGLELARRVFESMRSVKKVSPAHVETLAMAHAEVGEFPAAIQWQQQAIEFVSKHPEMADRLTWLKATLARYERGEPCREPWGPNDPQIHPRSTRQAELAPHACSICEP